MRLVFFDPAFWDYDMDTALDVGLGGSQSALCYLSAELVQRGHDVVVVNGVPAPRTSHGVRFLPHTDRLADLAADVADVMIVLNAVIGTRLRHSGITTKLVLWTHHDVNQPAVQALAIEFERDIWNAIVCVSQWQADRYRSTFGLGAIEVIGNGVAPPFLEQEIKEPWFKTGRPPILAYTSTPYRGLERLLDCWLEIRKEVPDARLRVFSDMRVYQATDYPYQALYDRARRLEGVEYIGSIGQRALARQLSECALLAYPCVFPETFCISAAEAAAVGCQPCVPVLGALGETLGPAGIYMLIDIFPRAIVQVLRHHRHRSDVDVQEKTRGKAIEFIRKHHNWAKRAQQWESLLQDVGAP